MSDAAKSAEEVVRKFDRTILETGDFEAAMAFAHPELTIRENPNFPYSQAVYVGLKGLEELHEDLARYWDFSGPLEVTFFGASESLAVVRFEGTAQARLTGEEVDFLATEWATVRDGKVADIEVFYFDQKPLFDAVAVELAGGRADSGTGPGRRPSTV